MVTTGLIVPPLNGKVPPDAAALYPRTRFLVEGIGVTSLTAEGYAEAESRLEDRAVKLAERGASALLLFGTSLSFERGPAFNDALEARMRRASGLPSMTLTTALSKALRQLGAVKLAVATAYTDAVNSKFDSYFSAEGFDIQSILGMDLTDLAAVEETGAAAITDLARAAAKKASDADALVISCAGLTTSGITDQLEAELGLPVISSSMIGAWAAQGLAGGSTFASGFGKIYQQRDVTWPSA